MNYQLHNVYTFDNKHETILDWTDSSNSAVITNNPPNQIQSIPDQTNLLQLSHWRPSSKLQRLYDKF